MKTLWLLESATMANILHRMNVYEHHLLVSLSAFINFILMSPCVLGYSSCFLANIQGLDGFPG